MKNSQLQTPQRDQTPANRRAKTTSDLDRNVRRGVRKSLNPLFKAESENDHSVLESLKEFSEVSDESPFSESTENFIVSVHPSETHSLDTVAVSDLTSIALSSVTATPYKQVAFDMANNKIPEVDCFKMAGTVEAEVVIRHLKEARIQVFKSKDLGSSKRLVGALITIIIEELHGGPYEKNEWLDKLLSGRSSLVFLMSIVGIFYLLMVWFLNWSSEESFTGLTPT